MSDSKEAPPLAGHVGREQTFEALGRTWRLARWDRAVWRDLLEWARPRIPDPRKTAAEFLAMLPPAVTTIVGGVPITTDPNGDQKTEIVKAALADAQEYLSPTSPKVNALLGTLDGVCELFRLLLKPAQPDITDDQAYEIVLTIGQKQAEDLAKGTAGIAPPPKDDGESPASPSSTNAPSA